MSQAARDVSELLRATVHACRSSRVRAVSVLRQCSGVLPGLSAPVYRPVTSPSRPRVLTDNEGSPVASPLDRWDFRGRSCTSTPLRDSRRWGGGAERMTRHVTGERGVTVCGPSGNTPFHPTHKTLPTWRCSSREGRQKTARSCLRASLSTISSLN